MEMSGEQLKEIRERLGKSLGEMGKELGVSHSTIQRWERGDKINPEVIRKVIEMDREFRDALNEEKTTNINCNFITIEGIYINNKMMDKENFK